jgi:hypothetical protein
MVLVAVVRVEGPVVVGGHRLRHRAADLLDVGRHVGGRHLQRRPVDHGLVADADGQHHVLVGGGERDAARDLGLVLRIVAGLGAVDPDAQLHFDVQLVVGNGLQHQLRVRIAAAEHADQAEVPLLQQLQVLEHLRRRGRRVVVGTTVAGIGDRLAREELAGQRALGGRRRGRRVVAAAVSGAAGISSAASAATSGQGQYEAEQRQHRAAREAAGIHDPGVSCLE